MAVTKIAETEIHPRLTLIAPDEDVPAPPKPRPPGRDEEREARNAAALVAATATMAGLAKIVSTRLILIFAVCGALALSMLVVSKPSWPSLIVLAIYAAGVMIPTILLESGALAQLWRRA